MPENWPGRFGRKGPGLNLTNEQRATLHATIKEMRDKNATRDEIHAKVAELFKEWGIEKPESDQETRTTKNAETSKIQASNFPNPFNLETKITYTLPAEAYVTLSIYNTQGQFIKTLINQYQSEGTHSIIWDARNAQGEIVPSGMYFYRIIAGKDVLSQRMVLMK